MKQKGFTLIEILVVIAIIASIIAVAIPNYLSARQRASDVKKKENMEQLKTALRLYYNDYNSYSGRYQWEADVRMRRYRNRCVPVYVCVPGSSSQELCCGGYLRKCLYEDNSCGIFITTTHAHALLLLSDSRRQ